MRINGSRNRIKEMKKEKDSKRFSIPVSLLHKNNKKDFKKLLYALRDDKLQEAERIIEKYKKRDEINKINLIKKENAYV